MKQAVSFLLAALFCLSCALPAFAKNKADANPLPAGASADLTAQNTPAALSAASALPEAYLNWAHGEDLDVRGVFDRAYRQYYPLDPDVLITDHKVYVKETRWKNSLKQEPCYKLIDYFDTDEAEQAARVLHIPAEVNGLPVEFGFYGLNGAYGYGGFGNDTVTEAVLDEGFQSVGAFAFDRFTALKTVTIPASAVWIAASAFAGCKQLKTVRGAKNVTRVAACAFRGCESLAAFAPMEQLTQIGDAAFFGCGFKTLKLFGSAEIAFAAWGREMELRSFAECKKLKSVTFLNGKKNQRLWIGNEVFAGCSALETVTFPKKCGGVYILDRAFRDCTALKTLSQTARLTCISRKAFLGCTALERVTLPAGIETVAEDAFKGCKHLKTFDIRSNDVDLFGRTFEIDDLYYGGEPGGVTTNFLKYLPKKCTVFVPALAMKQIAEMHGCKGKVKVKLFVSAPKTLKAVQKNGTSTLQWSKVKAADGYRIYARDDQTGKLTPLKTVKAPTTAVTLKTIGRTFAVKAFRDMDGDRSWSKETLEEKDNSKIGVGDL